MVGQANTGTQQPMSTIDNWGDMHQHRETWVNPQAEQNFVSLLSFIYLFFYYVSLEFKLIL